MNIIRVAAGLAALLPAMAMAQAINRALGLPPPASPGTTEAWLVYTCPNEDKCKVPVKLSLDANDRCVVDVPQFVDRSATRNTQVIEWTITASPSGWTAAFDSNKGIDVTEGSEHATPGGNSNSQSRSITVAKDPRVGMRRSLLLYDINIELKRGNESIKCNRGPGIINRG